MWIELILGILLLISLLLKDVLHVGLDPGVIAVVSMPLAFLYLVGNWWLTKGRQKTFRFVALTILYGITSASFIFGIAFISMKLTGAAQMVILSGMLLIISIGLDLLLAIGRTRVIHNRTVLRLGALVLVTIIEAFAYL